MRVVVVVSVVMAKAHQFLRLRAKVVDVNFGVPPPPGNFAQSLQII